MKKIVYEYLDMLFSTCDITINEEEFRATDSEENIICLINTGIFFSYRDFYLIVRFFNLSEGESVDYITDYLSENFPSLELDYMPFWPHL